jgi:hypothetical protein
MRAVAEMLKMNTHNEEIALDSSMLDGAVWDTHVAPELEWNRCRKWFLPIQSIENSLYRSAVPGRLFGCSCLRITTLGQAVSMIRLWHVQIDHLRLTALVLHLVSS